MHVAILRNVLSLGLLLILVLMAVLAITVLNPVVLPQCCSAVGIGLYSMTAIDSSSVL